MDAIFSAAEPRDFEELSHLVNAAYRSGEGWTHEAHLVEGPRTSPEELERELASPDPTEIVCARETAGGPIQACVLLRLRDSQVYLGMLSVNPKIMNGGWGRSLLTFAEDWARARAAERIVMTVLEARAELLAWYQRRGYRPTGESVPFPGTALRFAVLEKSLL